MLDSYLNYIQEQVKNFKIGPSKIHGKGVISTIYIKADSFINNALIPTNKEYKTTLFGSYLNHSKKPNAITKKEDDIYKTYALVDIKLGDEITVDYTKNKELQQPKPGWK